MKELLKLKNVDFVFLNEKELEKKINNLKTIGEVGVSNLKFVLTKIKKQKLKKVYYSTSAINEKYDVMKFFEENPTIDRLVKELKTTKRLLKEDE